MEGNTQRIFHLVTPQMATTLGPGSGQIREPGASSWCPVLVLGLKHSGQFLLLIEAFSKKMCRKWSSQDMDCYQGGMLAQLSQWHYLKCHSAGPIYLNLLRIIFKAVTSLSITFRFHFIFFLLLFIQDKVKLQHAVNDVCCFVFFELQFSVY